MSWINSLFTIFCRAIACSSYSGFMFSTVNKKRDFQANFAANEMGLLVENSEDYLPWPIRPMKGLEYAVQLVYTVLSSHFLRDFHRCYWEYLSHYIPRRAQKLERTPLFSRSIYRYGYACHPESTRLLQTNFYLPTQDLSWSLHVSNSARCMVHDCHHEPGTFSPQGLQY